MLNNVWLAFGITFILALAWLRLNDFFAHKGWVSGRLSRKIIHIGTGPIFVLCWLLFPDLQWSRYLAATIPLAITIQFFLVGTGIVKDQAAVDAMTRAGDRREIIYGPLFYGIVFVGLTIIYWKDSLIGIVALMLLCGGDGLADVLGSRISSGRLPWSGRKSIIGTISMFLGGWIMAILVGYVFIQSGTIPGEFSNVVIPITMIAAAGALVESLPLKDWDNITVPMAAVILGHFLF